MGCDPAEGHPDKPHCFYAPLRYVVVMDKRGLLAEEEGRPEPTRSLQEEEPRKGCRDPVSVEQVCHVLTPVCVCHVLSPGLGVESAGSWLRVGVSNAGR